MLGAEKRLTGSKRAAALTRTATPTLNNKIVRFRKVGPNNSGPDRPDLHFGPQVAALIIRSHQADRTMFVLSARALRSPDLPFGLVVGALREASTSGVPRGRAYR
jgi:hypothetical protein